MSQGKSAIKDASAPRSAVKSAVNGKINESKACEEIEGTSGHDLNEIMHQLLVVGLIASVFFMLTGIAIDLIRHRSLPTTVLPLSEAFSRTVQLRASGFFSIGLLLLILTPFLRVLGSLLVFIWERDWRYAGITFLVFIVMLISVLVGEG